MTAKRENSAVIRRVLVLGLAGGLLAGGMVGAAVIFFTGNVEASALLGWVSFGFVVGMFYGMVTGAIASGVFLLVWVFARKLPTLVGSCVLSSLAAGAAITALFALVLAPGGSRNVTLGVVHFNWIVLCGCAIASGVYFWLSWTAARCFSARNT